MKRWASTDMRLTISPTVDSRFTELVMASACRGVDRGGWARPKASCQLSRPAPFLMPADLSVDDPDDACTEPQGRHKDAVVVLVQDQGLCHGAHEHEPGHQEAPPGGGVRVGDEPDQNAARERKEV